MTQALDPTFLCDLHLRLFYALLQDAGLLPFLRFVAQFCQQESFQSVKGHLTLFSQWMQEVMYFNFIILVNRFISSFVCVNILSNFILTHHQHQACIYIFETCIKYNLSLVSGLFLILLINHARLSSVCIFIQQNEQKLFKDLSNDI